MCHTQLAHRPPHDPNRSFTLRACTRTGPSAARPQFRKELRRHGYRCGYRNRRRPCGQHHVAGTTTSLDFPIINAFQPHIGGTPLRMSADQGNTWLAPSVPAPIYAVAGSPKQPNIVFAGTANGILKSLDSGKTWTSLSAAPTYRVNALVVDSVNPDLVYAATTSGTYQSRDGGMTWRLVDRGGWDVDVLVSAPARNSTLFSAIETGGRSPSVYRTTDSGSTWSLLANPRSVSSRWHAIPLTRMFCTPPPPSMASLVGEPRDLQDHRRWRHLDQTRRSAGVGLDLRARREHGGRLCGH